VPITFGGVGDESFDRAGGFSFADDVGDVERFFGVSFEFEADVWSGSGAATLRSVPARSQ
jgi:hypothetical protein